MNILLIVGMKTRGQMKDKAYSWFDVITKFVDVCYSCSSQNIDTSNEQYICKDCKILLVS